MNDSKNQVKTDKQKLFVRVMKEEDIPMARELQTTVSVLTYSEAAWKIFATNPRFLSLLLFIEEKGEQKLAALSISETIWSSKFLPKRDAIIMIYSINPDFQNAGINSILLSITNYIHFYYFCVDHIMIENFKDNVYLFNFYKENGFIGYLIKKDCYLIKDKKFDSVSMVLIKKNFKQPKLDELNIDIHPEVEHLMTTKQNVPCFCPVLFMKK